MYKLAAIFFAIVIGGWMLGGYRTFQPTDSAAMAGWVQAVGSIAAIALAITLQYRATTDNRRQAQLLAKVFSAQLVLSFDCILKSSESQAFGVFKTQRHVLHDTLRLGENLPLTGLDSDYLHKVFILRTLTIEALSHSDGHTEGGNWAHQADLWREVLRQANEVTGSKDSTRHGL